MISKRNIKNNRKGFTLIELIVVMIIIGILVLLAAPRFLNYIKKARYTNIINDVKVTETVSLPQMVRGKRKFPVGTGNVENPKELLDGIDNQAAYMKDGYVLNYDKVEKDFKPEVGKISKVTKADINDNNKFYMLDKADFVKKETSTTLKGQFYINIDGDVIYVDDPSIDGETPGDFDEEEAELASQMYIISTEGMEKGESKITGINLEGFDGDENDKKDKWAEKFLIKVKEGEYHLPEVPKYDKDANKIIVLENDLGIFGLGKWKVVGDLRMPYIEEVKDYVFRRSNFTGDFIAPNVKKIGEGSFIGSKFTGSFEADNIVEIGSGAFQYSRFDGDFIAPKLKRIVGTGAFYESPFRGEFYAPEIEHIGAMAFGYDRNNGANFHTFTPDDSDMMFCINHGGREWNKNK